MLKFEIIQELQPNSDILKLIKNYTYTVKNGEIKHLRAANLQFVEPTQYVMIFLASLTILE